MEYPGSSLVHRILVLALLVPHSTLLFGCDEPSSKTPSGTTPGTTLEAPELDYVIDDFEDGDAQTVSGGGWYDYNDGPGGNSTIEITRNEDGTLQGEGFASDHALRAEFSFDQGTLTYPPYVGFGATLGDSDGPFDLSEYSTLQYVYRGAAHSVRLETYAVEDYDFHVFAVPASTSWKVAELPLALFTQEGWGTKVPFDPADIAAISFHVRGATGESAFLEIDDLGAVEESGETEPDLVIQDPAPPSKVEIVSVEVDNPLQARAMESLDKGYNITNWLEQDRFQKFEYDEEFVTKLAAAGFRALRLPIDLDLYVDEVSGSGDELEVTVDDDLFLVLDSFDEWTKDNGLSFTIDFHQYDRSLDFADDDSKDLAVALWGLVAEHFAENPREDLFFELLNEPELSAGGTAPTQAQWTSLAEAMIARIREHDTTHTIIFGDVEWYGITPLSKREPLSDDNVIYSFHFYEPFIFTHQGASWANMGSTHDLPFPYDPERWSDRSADLGFTPFMESWILGEVKNYYRNGSPEALWNRIVTAKRWAVDHQVPVICNEFGAYDATSQLEDRSRYYEELIDIFAEFEIPWQHWFMIMQDDGGVIPEYKEAFRLE